MRWLCTTAVAVCLLLAGNATADPLLDGFEVGDEVPLSHQLKKKLTLLSEEVGLRLSDVTVKLVDVRYDAFSNQAAFHLGGGDASKFALNIDSDIFFSSGAARFQSTLHLGLAGREVSFDVPEFELVPRSDLGQRYVELRIPLLRARF